MAIKDKRAAKLALLFGALSVALYILLFYISDLTIEWARLTRLGHKEYFIVPVVIALVFSYVHGTFTSHFWDMLGFKPAAKHKGGK
ncbi:MAG: hypothetical protein AABY83_14345 [Pseudomonadota bacterium]